jgi:hypothetical protein
VEVHAVHGAVRGGGRVGVGADHAGVLASQLQRHVLHGALGGRALDGATGGHAPDERDAPHCGVAHQGVARHRPVARDDVQHPGRQEVGGDLAETQRGERRLIRGLQHHRVAGHQRAGDLPRREHDRVVVRDDARHDAVGLAKGVVQVVGRAGDRLAPQLQRRRRREAQERRREPHVAAHRGDGVAAVDGVEHGQLLLVGEHGLGEPGQRLRAGPRAHPRPVAGRIRRSPGGPVDLVRTRGRDLRDLTPG